MVLKSTEFEFEMVLKCFAVDGGFKGSEGLWS